MSETDTHTRGTCRPRGICRPHGHWVQTGRHLRIPLVSRWLSVHPSRSTTGGVSAFIDDTALFVDGRIADLVAHDTISIFTAAGISLCIVKCRFLVPPPPPPETILPPAGLTAFPIDYDGCIILGCLADSPSRPTQLVFCSSPNPPVHFRPPGRLPGSRRGQSSRLPQSTRPFSPSPASRPGK